MSNRAKFIKEIIVIDPDTQGEVEDFLRIEEDLGFQTSPSQAAWKKRYKDLASEFIENPEDLAIIENILNQN